MTKASQTSANRHHKFVVTRFGRIPLVRLLIAPAILVCGIVLLGWLELVIGGERDIDFAAYWHASQVILRGIPTVAYGIGTNPYGNYLPIAYPPPFLFIITPLALLPFGLAFGAWIFITGAFYVATSRHTMALANPGAAYNGLLGQNGFLTTGIMLLGLGLISGHPAIGGAILGLMIIKPQLALVLPLVVIAGRLWQAIPAAIASAATLLALAALVFETDAYVGFLHGLSVYSRWLTDGRWPWSHMASFYAVGRWFGLGSAAWALHAIAAIGSAVAVWISWRQDWDSKVPIAASASLLISPYLFPYDGVLLVAPLAYLAPRRPVWGVAVWLLAALQLLRLFGFYYGPPTTPLAAAAAIIAMATDKSSRCHTTSERMARSLTTGLSQQL